MPVNTTLMAWVGRKCKPLREHKTRASMFLIKITEKEPRLLANWQASIESTFA